jgi:hypothetical protein
VLSLLAEERNLKVKKYSFGIIALIVILSLILTACGGATVTPTVIPGGNDNATQPILANCAPASSVPPTAATTPISTTAPAVPAPTPTTAPLPVPTVALPSNGSAVLNEVEQEAAKVRGLNFIKPVDKYLVKRSDLGNYFLEDFKRTTTPEEIANVEKTLRLFGFTSQNFDYLKTYAELLGEQVLGFYQPDTKKFYVVVEDPSKPISPLGQQTTQHELTHALQDQYFDLRKMRPIRKPSDKEWNDDREYAVTSLIEGDAVQSGNQWLLNGYLSRQELSELLNEAQSAASQEVLNRVPAILRETLTFPYVEGANFVARLCQQGGWDAVNKAYTEYPPVSTSQILHFDKYTKRIEPVKVDLTDMTATLGNGWKSIDINTFGELQIRIWLNAQMSKADAAKAANGWAGDRYQVVENAQQQLGFVWRSVWDSDNEAREFFESANKYLTAQFKLSGGSGDKRTWQTNEYDLISTIKGKEVLLSVMPKGDSLNKVVQKLGF